MEIEAKIKLKSPSRLRALLKSAEAERQGLVLERNWLYDYPDRSLVRSDRALRLRQDQRVILTFKGPRDEESIYKSREEREFEFPELPRAHSLLESLGFASCFYYEKYRESWKLEACEVVLDELPTLGLYVEIEGSNDEDVAKTVKRLKLPRKYITQTYVELLQEHSGAHQTRNLEFRFPPDHQSILEQDKKARK
jgi:predicted adenylyl cyclase CyaB